jgi:acetylornithine/N-succinyldiaminopimelate aminotransferase
MITVAAGDNVVRLLPPLVISEQELAEAVARIDRAAARVERTLDGAAKAQGAGR